MNFYPAKNVDIDYGALGIRLRILRGREKQNEFGKRFGLTQADVSRYENGTKPPVDFLLNVSLKYKKPIEWILVGKGEHLKKDSSEEVQEGLDDLDHEVPGVDDLDVDMFVEAVEERKNIPGLVKKLEYILRRGTERQRYFMRRAVEAVFEKVKKEGES